MAAVGMSKVGRSDHHASGSRTNPDLLVVKFGLSTHLHVIQIKHEQQHAMQCFVVTAVRVNFAVHIRITSGRLLIPLGIDLADAKQSLQQQRQLGFSDFCKIINRNTDNFTTDRVSQLQTQSADHGQRMFVHVVHDTASRGLRHGF